MERATLTVNGQISVTSKVAIFSRYSYVISSLSLFFLFFFLIFFKDRSVSRRNCLSRVEGLAPIFVTETVACTEPLSYITER